jgi:hypothetical protein
MDSSIYPDIEDGIDGVGPHIAMKRFSRNCYLWLGYFLNAHSIIIIKLLHQEHYTTENWSH